jgi:triosephosphate isomerase
VARTPLLAGNWKMHGTRADARALAGALARSVGQTTGREVLIAPPFTALDVAGEAIAGTRILLAAQNVHGEDKGAFTGEVSAAMLAETGCTHVIIGHSERRQYYGETDAGVNARLRGALRAGLTPIVCVGETLAEREAGSTMAVIERQVRGALAGIDQAGAGRCVLAYEPVWAIGTGRTATPDQAQEVHAAIRKLLAELTGPSVADSLRILYGGSVKADNVDALMAQPDLDGALVGGASLDPAAFTRIVQYQESR